MIFNLIDIISLKLGENYKKITLPSKHPFGCYQMTNFYLRPTFSFYKLHITTSDHINYYISTSI